MNAEEPPPSSSVRSEHPDVSPVGADGKAAAERGSAERAERILEARLQRMETYLGFKPLTEADAELILGGRGSRRRGRRLRLPQRKAASRCRSASSGSRGWGCWP